jgi:hypothetical protein
MGEVLSPLRRRKQYGRRFLCALRREAATVNKPKFLSVGCYSFL